MKYIINLILAIASSVFWRLGGSDDYNKLWRRIGSALCMCLIIFDWRAIPTVVWGCVSYFGWINNFLPWIKDKEREYWWNFFAENLVIQTSVLWVSLSFSNAIFSITAALAIALIKVLIDEEWKLTWRPRKDVLSELTHGGANAAFLAINILFI